MIIMTSIFTQISKRKKEDKKESRVLFIFRLNFIFYFQMLMFFESQKKCFFTFLYSEDALHLSFRFSL